MNLYEKWKRDLVGKPLPLSRVRVHTTEGPMGIFTYRIADAKGQEVAFHRSDAVVIMHGLSTALKKTS